MFCHTIYKNRAKLKHFVSVWQVFPVEIVSTLVVIFHHFFLFFVRVLRYVCFREFFTESPIFFISWVQKVVSSFKVAANAGNELLLFFCQHAIPHRFSHTLSF